MIEANRCALATVNKKKDSMRGCWLAFFPHGSEDRQAFQISRSSLCAKRTGRASHASHPMSARSCLFLLLSEVQIGGQESRHAGSEGNQTFVCLIQGENTFENIYGSESPQLLDFSEYSVKKK